MNNALGSSVIALGSSITRSNVRKSDAVTLVAASLIALAITTSMPATVSASTGVRFIYNCDFAGAHSIYDSSIPIPEITGYTVLVNGYWEIGAVVSDDGNMLHGSCIYKGDSVFRLPQHLDTLMTGQPDGNYYVNTLSAQGDTFSYVNFSIINGVVHMGNEFPYVTPVNPAPCTTDCNSNVLFLPGIEASRLYDTDGGEKRLWEPGGNADAMQLAMTSQGTSVRSDIYTKGILDEAYVLDAGPNIYKSFIASMNVLKSSSKINDWTPVPYDWRLSLDDVLNGGTQTGSGISYLSATNTPYIEQTLRHLAATSRTGKVTIIAHSNGGLVAKALMLRLGASTTASLIDKVIFVAVPQIGTPAAIGALLHGYDQGIPFGKVSDATMRTLGNHSPAAYNLLPSVNYFTYVDDPVATFDPITLPDWTARYGTVVHSKGGLHKFLTDSYARVAANSTDTTDPVSLDETLLTQSENVHAALDSWTPSPGVQLIQIAGWGIPTTLAGIDYTKGTSSVCFPTGLCTPPKPISFSASTTVDGDGTVPVPSALWVSTTTGAVDYWVDLKQYNSDHPFQSAIPATRFKHSRILEVQPLLSLMENILEGSILVFDKYIETQIPASIENRLRFSLHSPLTLNLYDDQGRHTGISTTTGQVEEQIPGTYYMEFGDVKYIFSDASSSAHIVMNGYAPGTFTFNVDQYAGDSLTASITFKDIPTSTTTTATIAIQSNISTLSPMSIDKNGDGISDMAITPKLNGTVTLDTTPPEFRIGFATSTNTLSITATDDMGTTTISASTTYPALKKGQKDYRGIATSTVIARDRTGNMTTLIYTELLPSPLQRDIIFPQVLIYSGATATFVSTSVSYKWRVNSDGSYKLFASFLRTAATTTESHFRPKKGATVIMTKPVDLDDADMDDDADIRPNKTKLPGLVVPYMRTEKGSLIINY